MSVFRIVATGMIAFSSLIAAEGAPAVQQAAAVQQAPQQGLQDLFDEDGDVAALVPVTASASEGASQLTGLTARVESTSAVRIDMAEVFSGAPLIYSLLLAISIATLAIWFYTILNMRTKKLMPDEVVSALNEKIGMGKKAEALAICQNSPSLISRMMNSGLSAPYSSQAEMLEAMQNEGKLASGTFWQKLSLINDVAIVAPMIGLLGTVVGMFYAFYDMNRSVESMNTLFDGLGVSVGTTVAGLLLAILALVLHSTSKYRLVKQLTQVESTAQSLASKLYKAERRS